MGPNQKPKKNYFKLNASASIFNTLSEENRPEWWKKILGDSDLYINIRKNNRINVYYKGASVLDICTDRAGKLTAKIDIKYLDKDWGCIQSPHRTEPEKIVAGLERIKEKIKNRLNKKHNNPEGKSEKELQGEIYTAGVYIDTEYAYVYSEPKQLIIRIDLITIRKDGMIEFVELKRISDPRLLHKEDSEEEPEILRQMRDYDRFIKENAENIIKYYKTLQTIMKKIGVNNELVNREIKGVCPHVKLLFAPYKDKTDHPKRINRINRIKDLLNEHHIKYEDYHS